MNKLHPTNRSFCFGELPAGRRCQEGGHPKSVVARRERGHRREGGRRRERESGEWRERREPQKSEEEEFLQRHSHLFCDTPSLTSRRPREQAWIVSKQARIASARRLWWLRRRPWPVSRGMLAASVDAKRFGLRFLALHSRSM